MVFWKCKNVVAMDNFTEQNDLYIQSWVQGCDAQVSSKMKTYTPPAFSCTFFKARAVCSGGVSGRVAGSRVARLPWDGMP